VEGDADNGDTVRTAPLIAAAGEIMVRQKLEFLPQDFQMQFLDGSVKEGTLEAKA
jgi:hypothetical protein